MDKKGIVKTVQELKIALLTLSPETCIRATFTRRCFNINQTYSGVRVKEVNKYSIILTDISGPTGTIRINQIVEIVFSLWKEVGENEIINRSDLIISGNRRREKNGIKPA